MPAITLAGFQAKFEGDADPWSTFAARDEAIKREAILRALGPGPWGRVLELASGNGSNSAAIAPRARRLLATEGTAEGTRLTAQAIARWPRAEARQLALPAPLPRSAFDAIVVAEILYYLSPHAMDQVARDVACALRPGGRLVLAQHEIDFHDFAQHARGIHDRFLSAAGVPRHRRVIRRTARWMVELAVLT